MIRAIVFDFDGLIIDTETPVLEAWREVFAEHGAELTLETWIDCVGRPPGTFDPSLHLEAMGIVVDRERARMEMRRRARARIAEEGLRPGVGDWIERASELGLRLGIASSSSRDWVEGHLSRIGVLDRFQTLVCFEDVAAHKPDPEPYRQAAQRLDVSPEETIAVEDSSHGLQAALSAGLWCVAVPNEVTRESVGDLGHLQLMSLEEMSLDGAIERITRNAGVGEER